MRRLLDGLAHLALQFPFTLVMLASIIAIGLATGTPTHRLALATQQRWGFALTDFSNGTWYSLVTSVFFVNRPLMFWGILPFVVGAIGVSEWRLGWRRALWLFWLTDLAGKLAMSLFIVLPLYGFGTPVGYQLVSYHDVGMSGGGFGCLGGWMTLLPGHWQSTTLCLVTIYLLVRLFVFTELFADLLHLLTYFGGYYYMTWQGQILNRYHGDDDH